MRNIRNFPEYQDLTDDYVKNIKPKSYKNKFIRKKTDEIDNSRPEIEKLIFAPDEYTGHPRSDLAYILSKDSSPEIAQYVRENLLQAHTQTSQSHNIDEVLTATKSAFESDESFRNRLIQFVHDNNNVSYGNN